MSHSHRKQRHLSRCSICLSVARTSCTTVGVCNTRGEALGRQIMDGGKFQLQSDLV